MAILTVAVARFERAAGDHFRQDTHEERVARDIGVVTVSFQVERDECFNERQVGQGVVTRDSHEVLGAELSTKREQTAEHIVLVAPEGPYAASFGGFDEHVVLARRRSGDYDRALAT